MQRTQSELNIELSRWRAKYEALESGTLAEQAEALRKKNIKLLRRLLRSYGNCYAYCKRNGYQSYLVQSMTIIKKLMEKKPLSKAQIKAAICCPALARQILRHQTRFSKTNTYLLNLIAKLNDDTDVCFEQRLAGFSKLQNVPAMCRRLAYHLEVFTYLKSKVQKTVCLDLRIIGLRCGKEYDELVSLEPQDVEVYDTGEIIIFYNSNS